MENNTIKVSVPFGFSFSDYPDNNSACVTVYVLGCTKLCEGCHNPSLMSFKGSGLIYEEMDAMTLSKKILVAMKSGRTDKLVFQGGEPLHPINFPIISEAIRIINDINNDVHICVYTGYSMPDAWVMMQGVKFDYLKTGGFDKRLFVKPEKTDEYMQLASSNQEIHNERYECKTTEGRFYFSNR